MKNTSIIYEAMDEMPLRMRLMGWRGVRKDGTEWKVIIPERDRSEMKEWL